MNLVGTAHFFQKYLREGHFGHFGSLQPQDALNHRNVPHRGPYLFISAEEFSEVAINFGGADHIVLFGAK